MLHRTSGRNLTFHQLLKQSDEILSRDSMRKFLEKVDFVASAIDDACNGGPQKLNSQSFLQLHDYGSN